MAYLQVTTLERLNQELVEENQKLLQQNEELKENRLTVVPSKEILSGFGRSLSEGSYHLALLEKHVTYRSGHSFDGSLTKVASRFNFSIFMYFQSCTCLLCVIPMHLSLQQKQDCVEKSEQTSRR